MSRLRFPSLILIVLVLLFYSGFARAQAALDLEGRAVNPLAADSGKVVVLVFLRRDCPVSGRYAPVIQQVSRRYADRARFWLIYPDKTDSAQEIRKYLAEYNYHLPALRDPARTLVKLGHAQITPEVAVFGPSRKLVYDGRIDNWYVDLGRSRPAATTHELDDAIQAALAGKPVLRSEVRGVGCYISDLE